MIQINVQTIEDIPVARVKSENGIAGSKKAFDLLESRMNGLTGRKMYGVFYPQSDEYFACVLLDEQFPDDMGFERGSIPGGKYARQRLEGWSSKIPQIKTTFDQLEQAISDNKLEIDPVRPSIEYYRSFRELICMLPVR